MKVFELIECLQKLDPEADVLINDAYRVVYLQKSSITVVGGDVQLRVF